MEIIEFDLDFKQNLKYQFYNRRSIVVSLIEEIEISSSLDELEHISPCNHRENVYFMYDNVCKMYFEHFSKTNQVKLLNFVFAHHNF